MIPVVRETALTATLAIALGVAGCAPQPAMPTDPLPPGPSARRSAAAAPVELTLLFTSDEHGFLLAEPSRGAMRGGAAEALGQWIAREGHCPGPAGAAEADTARPAACDDPATILLSGGDNTTGPAISTHLRGASMARAMARMGYAAAAFGNHELDFGRDAFVANRDASRAAYVAANLHATDPAKELGVRPFVLVARRGVTVGVVGLVTSTTLGITIRSRFEGLAIDAEEPALARAVPAAYAAGADVVVVVAHACAEAIAPIVARHPEWRLPFVGVGHCHEREERRVRATIIASPGARFDRYVRVKLAIDPRRPVREKVVAASSAVVDVAHPEGEPPPYLDAVLARDVAAARTVVDAALGAPIGFSARSVRHDDPALGRFVTRAWREALGADVAVTNASGLRHDLPSGPISRGTVLSILPFENQLLVGSVLGRDLVRELARDDARYDGARDLGGGRFVDAAGRAIDPARRYSVVSTDFLFGGAAGFRLHDADPSPRDPGVAWRDPVVAWLVAHPSSPEFPLTLP